MPGRKYKYQSVAIQLLGLALRKATGKELSHYLSKKLWKPLFTPSTVNDAFCFTIWADDESEVKCRFFLRIPGIIHYHDPGEENGYCTIGFYNRLNVDKNNGRSGKTDD